MYTIRVQADWGNLPNDVSEVEVRTKCAESVIWVPRTFKGWVAACGSSQVVVCGNSRVAAYGNSRVTAYDNSQVVAHHNSRVDAYDNSQVTARDNSRVDAYDNSRVEAHRNSQVTARGSSRITAHNNSGVHAYSDSRVTARDYTWVAAYEDSQVEAYDGSQVVASGSSQVVAWGSSRVEAYSKSQITAHGYAQVLRRSESAAITLWDQARLVLPPATPQEFSQYYGVRIHEGAAILYKAVRPDYYNFYNGSIHYEVGGTYEHDCDPSRDPDCGRGLHVAHKGWALWYGRDHGEFKLIEVAVPLDSIVVPYHTDGKVRCSRLTVLREVPESEW